MKDKINQLLDALERPESFTNTEIEQMLADPEVRKAYDMLRKTADVSAPVPEINLDEEWQRFEAKQREHKPFILRLLPFLASRNAAAVVLALAGTLAVVAATIGVTHYIGARQELAQTQQTEQQEQTVVANTDIAPTDTIPVEKVPLPQTILFKGETLETILADIAKYYGVSVKFNQDASKSLQLYFEWNQALPLNEVVEQVNNFEQINITLTNNVLTVK
ncbi:MAG: DUF4974 domain-containing protein [Muribaculaceae bacterium]|nr:DUF4974 domain-containing protein [Muribaculaceae bacterium]